MELRCDNKRWQAIKGFIEREPNESPYRGQSDFYAGGRGGPQACCVRERAVIFGDRSLDLSSKPLVLRLFKNFFGGQGVRSRSKGDLIASLYYGRVTGEADTSRRLQECHSRNIVKLLSRARRLAREAFSHEEGSSAEHDWFAYDATSRSYCLYRRRSNDYAV